MTKSVLISAALLVCLTSTNSPVLAKWGQVTITDNNGEEGIVKHGLFGKKTYVKDRYGNGFKSKKSIFGLTKDTQVSALGNDVHVHKGLFGFGKTEGQDMLGDTVTSNKNIFYRNTNVNLSGANNLFNKYFGPQKQPPSLNPNALNNPGQIPPFPGGQSPSGQLFDLHGPQPLSQPPLDANSQAIPAAPSSNTPSY